jgi:spore coat protein U-like protein
MRNCKLFFTLGFVAVMSVSALAQTTATINVTAELLEGLQIDPVADLDLGSFVVLNGSIEGSLTIDPDLGGYTTNGLAVLTDPTLGSFRVLGSDGTVSISIEESVVLTWTNGSTSTFIFLPAAQSGSGAFQASGGNIVGDAIISGGVSQDISIGGTLQDVEQVDGIGSYSGTIEITVTYQ